MSLLTNASVHGKLPDPLKARATAIGGRGEGDGGRDRDRGDPGHNPEPRPAAVPPGARGDNGYVLTIGGSRVYVAGDTEDTPEMRALSGIDIAFVPMNLPYTMDVAQAPLVWRFAPGAVYPVSLSGQRPGRVCLAARGLRHADQVVLHDWYATA